MRVGAGDDTLAHSIQRVRAAREGLGDGVDIMCDAHGTWTVAEAKRFCREVAGCNLGWLEEPVCADDKRGQAEVRAATDIPIASGESEFTRFDFRDLIDLRAVDIRSPISRSPAGSPRRSGSRRWRALISCASRRIRGAGR